MHRKILIILLLLRLVKYAFLNLCTEQYFKHNLREKDAAVSKILFSTPQKER